MLTADYNFHSGGERWLYDLQTMTIVISKQRDGDLRARRVVAPRPARVRGIRPARRGTRRRSVFRR